MLMRTITASDMIIDLIAQCVDADQPLLLRGVHGIGKSEHTDAISMTNSVTSTGTVRNKTAQYGLLNRTDGDRRLAVDARQHKRVGDAATCYGYASTLYISL